MEDGDGAWVYFSYYSNNSHIINETACTEDMKANMVVLPHAFQKK